MARSTRSRPLYLLLVLALLAAPALAARESPKHKPAEKAAPSLAASAWTALLRLLAPSGGTMDPDGATTAKPATPPTASTIQPPATADSGAEMDPDG